MTGLGFTLYVHHLYKTAFTTVVFWIAVSQFPLSVSARKLRNEFRDRGVCNVTYTGSRDSDTFYSSTVIHPPALNRNMRGHSYHCVYEFRGLPGQRVMLRVNNMNVGKFDKQENQCVHGFLRLWDGSNQPGHYPYHPNTICGRNETNIRKFSTESRAMVEYQILNARAHWTFELQYQFINMEFESNMYTDQLVHDMKPTAQSNSICDWTVTLTDCFSEYQILSPGYPGMYPPDTQCVYHVVSPDPNCMVQVNFQGMTIDNKMRSFNLRSSVDCKDDYLSVEDNNIRGSQLVAKFCGKETYDIVTTGNNVTLRLSTSKQRPPFGHNGFHLSVKGMTKEFDVSGEHKKNTLCDWIFRSNQGSTFSPHHWLAPRTSCNYTFLHRPGRMLVLRFNVYGLGGGCGETIKIYNEGQSVATLCDHNIPLDSEDDVDKQDQMTYKLHGSVSSVVYTTSEGQYQGHEHRGFFLSFQQIEDPDFDGDSSDLQTGVKSILQKTAAHNGSCGHCYTITTLLLLIGVTIVTSRRL